MKIGIAGAFSTGKTTLAKELFKTEGNKYYHLSLNTEREVARILLFDFNKHTHKEKIRFQKFLVNMIIETTNVSDDIITDTPINMIPAYCDDDNIKNIVRQYSPYLYDILFYLPIEFDIENDGVRHIDKDYQKEVDKKIIEELQYSYKYNDKLVVRTLYGDINERLQQAKYYMDKWKEGYRGAGF